MKESSFEHRAYQFEMATAVRVTGEDAFNFLQSQFSNDLSILLKDSSTIVYGLWLNAKGRVLADSWVLKVGDEAYYLFSESSPSATLLAHLDAHIIADSVELEALPAVGSLILDFALARKIMQSLALIGGLDADVKQSIPYLNAGKGVFIYPLHNSIDGPCVLSFTDASLFERAVDCAKQSSVLWLSENARHLHRITARFPLIPKEIGPDDLAAEGGLVPRAVSLTKGCFLGQEVVARLHHLGKVQRQLYVITLVGSAQGIVDHLPFEIICSNRLLGEIRSLYRDESVADRYYAVALIKERSVSALVTGTTIGAASLQSICPFENFSC